MTVGLFIPCYINQFYPQVGIATVELLERLGVEVIYPENQTCCGQPMANAGFERYSVGTAELFVNNFKEFDYIVSPSGSCTYHVKKHFDILAQTETVVRVRNNVYELCEFLIKKLKTTDTGASFPYRVGLHQSCHGLRGLRLGHSSELVESDYSMAGSLLKAVKGIELIDLDREDECCGFGGTFAITEEAVSVKMGKDRIQDHLNHKVEYITGTDTSCLMHLEGIVKRQQFPVKVVHVAEILNSK
jgi:L-lactate dehydrogenase complex protein LldE